MKTIFLNNYKTLLYILFGVGALYLMVLFFTPKPEMSELDKYKLNQLNKDIQDIKNNQIKLDSTINKYYKEKGEEITGMKPSQIDSLFHKRYKY